MKGSAFQVEGGACAKAPRWRQQLVLRGGCRDLRLEGWSEGLDHVEATVMDADVDPENSGELLNGEVHLG